MTSVAAQHVFAILFGAIGTGKTTDALMAFPRALFIAAPGALKSSIGVAGFEPKALIDCASIPEITAKVEAVGKLAEGRRPDAVVIDDFSLYVSRQVLLSSASASGFDLWGLIYNYTLRLREAARRAGVHVVMTMHEALPYNDNGVRRPGTVALPGKKLPYDVPAAADMVLRAQPMAAGAPGSNPIGWPVVYRCDPADPEWRTKDRHNVTPDMSPMNIGEIMRLIATEAKAPKGWAPRRLPELEWHEEWVEKAAVAVLSKGLADQPSAKAILRGLHDFCMKRDPDERHALWACRDAWDRAVLRNALSSHRRKFFF